MAALTPMYLTFTQGWTFLSKPWPRRYVFILAAGVFYVLFLQLLRHPAIQPLTASISGGRLDTIAVHPVEELHNKWTRNFSAKLAGQSKTLDNAVKEYKRRYNRQPPTGFDVWFQYALDHNYVLVDEFDTLMDTLNAYWNVKPADIRAAVELGQNDWALTRVEVRDGHAKPKRLKYTYQLSDEEGAAKYEAEEDTDPTFTAEIAAWINIFNTTTVFPDMNLTINSIDEPRVNTPYVDSHASLALQSGAVAREDIEYDKQTDTIDWLNLGHRNNWKYLQASCPDTAQQRPRTKSAYSSSRLPFLDMKPSSQDFCEQVGIMNEHGFYQFPANLMITQSVLPVLSQCAPAHFNDILYPSTYYVNEVREKSSVQETDWSLKFNMLYWAGRSTGGYAMANHWMDIHRVRIALMTATGSSQAVTLLQKTSSLLGSTIYQPFVTTWHMLSHFFHVRITEVVQCDDNVCDEMKLILGTSLGTDDKSEAHKYKYLLDIDGNSFSGRFIRLLRSKSCVLKSTIFREWHDDLLTPWVHYVPVSTSANELGEMMRFFATERKGDAIGKSIADAGRTWSTKVLREADMEIYFLRVMMEYGRLVSDNRDTPEGSYMAH